MKTKKAKQVKKTLVVWDWCELDMLQLKYFPVKKRGTLSQACIHVDGKWIPLNRVMK